MIIDKLIFKTEHHEAAAKIANYLDDKLSYRKKQVAIFGIPGTGKTEIAFILREILCDRGQCTRIYHLDEYYKVPAKDRESERKRTGIIGLDEIDWNKLHRDTNNTFNSHYRMLLVEGLYAANAATNDFLIYVSGTAEDTLDFRIERGKEDVECEERQEVVEKEVAEVARLAEIHKIDLIV